MKILTVLGARPQFIKASVVSAQLSERVQLNEVVVHTGQHFDDNMSDVFFRELGMPKPAYFLNVHGGSHSSMTARMLIGLEEVMESEKPDVVIVYGDTNSTLAGALSAVKLHLPVAHVEAGLRSFNMRMPEEVNRVVTDRISTWLYVPTSGAAEQLKTEGIPADRVVQVGDVMFDVALHHGARSEIAAGRMDHLQARRGEYILATIHRAENTEDRHRFMAIVGGLETVAREIPVIWPIHPRARAALRRLKITNPDQRLRIIDPVSYLEMIHLERNAAVVATDSGGVQKEAFFQRVPCVTLRDETEWTELVQSGWNRLVSPVDPDAVASAILAAIGSSGEEVEPYGRGDAASRIVNHLESVL